MRPCVYKPFLIAGLAFALVGAKPADKKADTPKFNPQIPVGHTAKGITLPYFDTEGRLQMRFKIGAASRIDSEHLQMTSARIETFDEDGGNGMTIDLPSSILDLNTRVVTSSEPVRIERWDFQMEGQTMEVDTDKRRGKFGGKVRMLIFNRDEVSGS